MWKVHNQSSTGEGDLSLDTSLSRLTGDSLLRLGGGEIDLCLAGLAEGDLRLSLDLHKKQKHVCIMQHDWVHNSHIERFGKASRWQLAKEFRYGITGTTGMTKQTEKMYVK